MADDDDDFPVLPVLTGEAAERWKQERMSGPMFRTERLGDEFYLGNRNAVDAYVRVWLHDTLGQIPPGGLNADWLDGRARSAARIFLGQSNDWTPISGDWNAPAGGIVKAMAFHYDLKMAGATPEALVGYGFLHLFDVAMDASVKATAGEIDWESDVESEIAALVDVLIGVDLVMRQDQA